jgi:hypothetical protein
MLGASLMMSLMTASTEKATAHPPENQGKRG